MSNNSTPTPLGEQHDTTGAHTPLKIGLVMAGGISAGAYIAGVLDFLIEAVLTKRIRLELDTPEEERFATIPSQAWRSHQYRKARLLLRCPGEPL